MSKFVFELQRFASLGSSSYGTSGNDTLNVTASGSAVYAYGGNDSIYNGGYDSVTIDAGDGNDTVYNYNGDRSSINGGYGADSIHAYDNDYVKVNAGDGADTVTGSYYNSTINGGAGNDMLTGYYYWNSSVVDGGDGNDTILATSGSINGGADNDQISLNTSSAYSRTVTGGTGNDTIYGNANATVGNLYRYKTGDGYDVINGYNSIDMIVIDDNSKYTRSTVGSDVVLGFVGGAITLSGASSKTVNVSGGSLVTAINNVINNTISGTTVSGTNGNDTINNEASNVLINAGAGNDSVSNGTGNHVSMSGGDGNDTLVNSNWNSVSLDGGNGNDILSNSANFVTMRGGAGNDSIVVKNVYAYLTTLDGGTGDDTLTAYGGSISGGADNDLVSLGSYVVDGSGDYIGSTVNGGTGNDTFFNNSNNPVLYQYTSGDGNDVIINYHANDTISIGGSYYYTRSTVGSNVIINLTSGGAMTLDGASDKTINIVGGNRITDNIINNTVASTTVTGTTGNDKVSNKGSYVTVSVGSGNDSVFNGYVSYISVNGGAGNDTINNQSAWYSTVDAGDGADTVLVSYRAFHDSINGGAGNDKISLGTSSLESYNGYNTIVGGAGNDTIYGNPYASGGNVYQYNAGDGYDSILNYNSNDTISIGGSVDYTSSIVGSNVVISLASGAMTLSGASDKTINIVGGNRIIDNVINNTVASTTVTGTTGNDKVSNKGSYVTVSVGSGSDSVFNGYVSYISVNGGAGNDTINNQSVWYSTVDAGDGADTVLVSYRAYYDSINGGAGNDKISLGTSSLESYNGYNTIVGGAGNDTIYGNPYASSGNVYQYNAGDGYDSILNYNSNDTISISGGSWSTTTSGNDVIVSISGSGAMTLVGAKGKTLNIYPTVEADKVINNYTKNSVVSGASGKDTINNYAGGAKIYGNGGNDYIYNSTNSNYTINSAYGYVTIDGGNGNDTIYSYDPRVSINGGAGADRISLRGNYSGITINGGTGNDTIYGNSSVGVLYQYAYGDGYDSILNYNSNDTISIGGSVDYISSIVGSNVVISLASGAMTLGGASDKTINIVGGNQISDVINNTVSSVPVKGTTGNDTVSNKGSYVTVSVGSGNDSVFNGYVDYVSVNGGAGADTINNQSAWYSTVDAGDGADTVLVSYRAFHDSINGGAGNDKISLGTSSLESYNGYNTIVGGAGDDKIYGNPYASSGNVYRYNTGDGYDTIVNYNANDTITISSGNWSTTTSGNDVIVSIKGSGSMTLVDAKGKNLNIYPAKATVAPDTVVTQQDVIKKFMYSMDKSTSTNVKTLLDNAIYYASDHKYSSLQNAIDSMVADCRRAGNYDTFLRRYCGIIIDNDDTGAITGSDAGGKSIKTASSVVREDNAFDSSFTKNYFSYGGLNVYLGDGKTYYDLGEKERYIWQGLKSWWLDSSLDLIAESYGNNFSFGDQSSNTMDGKLYVKFYNEKSGVCAGVTSPNFNSSGDAYGSLTLSINMYKYGKIKTDNRDGESSSSSFYLDRVLAHEFTHAVMNANIKNATGWSGLPQFIKDGMAELTHGVDDERDDEIIKLAKDPSALEQALDTTKLYQHYAAYAGGYMFLRYLAKQCATNTDSSDSEFSDNAEGGIAFVIPNGITVKDEMLKVSTAYKGEEIDLSNYDSDVVSVDASEFKSSLIVYDNALNNFVTSGKGSDKVFGGEGNDTILGNAGADTLYGGSGNDSLFGGDGDDELYGGLGKNILTGGDGKDIFVYEGGNDIITDYDEEDKIKITSGEVTKATLSNSDVIITTDSGLITIKGGKGKVLTLIDYDEIESTTLLSGATATNYTNSSVAKNTLASGVQIGDATARTKTISIVGNKLDNTITGGSNKNTLRGGAGNDSVIGGKAADKLYGDAGSDTLVGGKGNDTLTGGDGNDLFIYSTGKDVIADYAEGDRVSIGAAITKTSISGSDALFSIGSGTLKIKNSKGKEISFINADGTEQTIIGGAYLATNSTSSKITLGSSYEVADASARTKAIKLVGNSLDNTIFGGSKNDTLYGKDGNDYLVGNVGNDKLYGQNGDDTLIGGAGNDSLWGEIGSDKFVYNSGDGKDIIYGFDNTDILDITGVWTASYNKSSKKISFTVDGMASAITLKDFGSTSIFNVNGTAYKISGTKLIKK